MMNKSLVIFGLLCMIAAALISIISHVSAQTTTNETNTNETNTLLKQILNQSKLQTQLTQDNANTIATKLDNIKIQLQHMLTQMQVPPPLPPLPPGVLPCDPNLPSCNLPPLPPPRMNPGCGIGTDNSLCNVPIPPPFLGALPLELDFGPVTDCIYTVYGVLCPIP